MNKTTIEWVKNPDGSPGFTWNPITGCLGPNGDGVHCPYCYARRLANGRLKARYLQNLEIALPCEEPKAAFNDPFYPRYWPERLNDFGNPFNKSTWRRKRKGVFTCDMGELFGPWVPRESQASIIGVIAEFIQHRFYLLTKQPQELIKWSPFPENCWVGVTGTSYQRVTDACGWLDNVEAKVKFISIEPLLSWNESINTSAFVNWISDIDWLIIGAQTRPYKPPKLEWVQEIVQAADKARIPVFLKDNLEPLLRGAEGLWELFYAGDYCMHDLRQEMPGKHSLENIKRR